MSVLQSQSRRSKKKGPVQDDDADDADDDTYCVFRKQGNYWNTYTNMFNPHSGANLIMRKIRPGSVRNLIKVIKLVNHDLGCRTLSSDIIFFMLGIGRQQSEKKRDLCKMLYDKDKATQASRAMTGISAIAEGTGPSANSQRDSCTCMLPI